MYTLILSIWIYIKINYKNYIYLFKHLNILSLCYFYFLLVQLITASIKRMFIFKKLVKKKMINVNFYKKKIWGIWLFRKYFIIMVCLLTIIIGYENKMAIKLIVYNFWFVNLVDDLYNQFEMINKHSSITFCHETTYINIKNKTLMLLF